MNDKKKELIINIGFVICLLAIFAYMPCLGQSYDDLSGETIHADGTPCSKN